MVESRPLVGADAQRQEHEREEQGEQHQGLDERALLKEEHAHEGDGDLAHDGEDLPVVGVGREAIVEEAEASAEGRAKEEVAPLAEDEPGPKWKPENPQKEAGHSKAESEEEVGAVRLPALLSEVFVEQQPVVEEVAAEGEGDLLE